MPKIRISKATVDAAATQAGQATTYWDEKLPGFGLTVHPSGSKTFIYRYRIAAPGRAADTAPKKYTIGKHGALTPDQARNRAQELAALVHQGIDPREQERESHAAHEQTKRERAEKERWEKDLAFDVLSCRFLDWYENEMGRRPSSVSMAEMIMRVYLRPAFGNRPLPMIGRNDLQKVLDDVPVSKRGIRRNLFAYASIFWGWALRRGYVDTNPLVAMHKPPAPSSRDRVLTDDELAAILNASDKLPLVWKGFFQLLILTAQRRTEVSKMMWSELDRTSALWTIPTGRTKNDKGQIVPLSASATELLDELAGGVSWPRSGFVLTTNGRTPISGISKSKAMLDGAVASLIGEPIPAWRIHDIRRTVATGLQRLGVRFEVNESLLAHVSGSKSGVAGIYQRYDWASEKKAAVDAWATFIANLLSNADRSNVIAFGAHK